MTAPEWVPQHDRQHAPFEPGNTVAEQHGAFSPRKVDPLAREIRDQVLVDEQLAYLRAPRWQPAVWSWCQVEAQLQLLTEYLNARGKEAGDGVGNLDEDRVRSAYLLQHRARAHADRLRGQLGLTPVSWARLMKDGNVARAAAASTATVMAKLHQLERDGVQVEPTAPAAELDDDVERQR
jgi:hypothetical protein